MAALNLISRGIHVFSKLKTRNAELFCCNVRFLSLCCSRYKLMDLHFRRLRNKIIDKVYFSNEATVMKTETVVNHASMSTFQRQMYFRMKQAKQSVLIELNKKEDIAFVASSCEKIGSINNLYSYSGESQNVFLLLEFADESSIQKLLHQCKNENISDAFSISSRILCFKKKFEQDTPKLTLNVNEDAPNEPQKPTIQSVSELIENIYASEKLSELNIRLRFFFCEVLKDSISGLFPHCDAYPFGSSVNGIGRHGCDLDIMIRLYPVPSQNNGFSEFSFLNKTCIGNIRELQKRSVYALSDYFSTFLPGFSSVRKILHARVPILKFHHKILGMECDVSINNVSPILMSEMLYFCGEIDSRVRPLLYAVKKWAKEANITYDSPGSWITNFGLSLLVIFFLQNRPVPVLPCINDAMQITGEEWSTNFRIEYLVSLSDLQKKASLNKESLAILLKEFLTFLGTHPFTDKHISILSGLATEKATNCPIWLQYPLEEEKNVTKNVSTSELHDMCEKARISSKYLAANLHQKNVHSKELSQILGVPNILKLFTNKSKKLDVSVLLADESTRNARKRINKRNAF